MSNHEILTDDYVAELLAKDARESSIRYSSIGLRAFTRSKPPANKPKPNTQFLRNIIKDTDIHNAALLAKEAAEAHERFRSLPGNGSQDIRVGVTGKGDTRKRQLGDIAAILQGKPSKRTKTDDINKPPKPANTFNDDQEHEHKSSLERKDYKNSSRTDKYESSRTNKDRRFRDVLDVLRERRRHGEAREGRRRSRSSLSPRISSKKRRDRSPTEKERHRSHRSHRDRGHRSKDSQADREDRCEVTKVSVPPEKLNYESDPLDDIIGPRPVSVPEVRTRGRGAISCASGIDSRFSAVYDPSADIQLDSDEENDWDQALETFRDRQKFKEKGLERLRAAGFTEEELKRLERGGERREEDFKWVMQGESREWDRGKSVDSQGILRFDSKFGKSEGHHYVNSSYGRLKDT